MINLGGVIKQESDMIKLGGFIKEENKLTIPQQHQKKIALKTLKMSDAIAKIMGGMTKDQAREFLKSIGYTDKQISKLEEGVVVENCDEAAVSQQQQKFFALVRAHQKGKAKDVSDKVKKVAKDISVKDADDFASTKTKDLPKRVKKEEMDEAVSNLKIKKTKYRGEDGYLIYGKGPSGWPIRIFTRTFASAIHIRNKKNKGEEIDPKDFIALTV